MVLKLYLLTSLNLVHATAFINGLAPCSSLAGYLYSLLLLFYFWRTCTFANESGNKSLCVYLCHEKTGCFEKAIADLYPLKLPANFHFLPWFLSLVHVTKSFDRQRMLLPWSQPHNKTVQLFLSEAHQVIGDLYTRKYVRVLRCFHHLYPHYGYIRSL